MSKLPPSKKKLEKTRREGKLAKSQLLSSSCPVLIFCISATSIFSLSWVKFKILLEYIVIEGGRNPVLAAVAFGDFFLKITGGCLILVAVVAILAEVSQVGVAVNFSALVSSSSRLGVVSGIRRITTGVKSCWFLLLKLSLCAIVLWLCVSHEYERLVFGLLRGEIKAGAALFGEALFRFIWYAAWTLGVVGVLDYALNRYKYFRDISMTHEEMRREHKDDQGDPLIKSFRRHQHHALAHESVVSRIKRSKVVVVETAAS